MRRLFIHVGFPKTATTTLQNHLFAKHRQINYLGKPFSDELASIERQILTLDSFLFEQRVPRLQAAFLRETARFAKGNLLISHEGFLRNTRHGGHDLGRTAKRLRRVFGEALDADWTLEIIVCLRNQVDLILSHYVQFIKGTQKDFDLYLKTALESPETGFPASLFYDELLSFYAAEFGRSNLHLLLFEDLIRDKAGFITALSDVLGIDSRESLSLLDDKHEKRKQKRGKGYVARGRSGLAKQLTQMLGTTVSISPQQRAEIEALYRKSNTRLLAQFDLPLDEQGYALDRMPSEQYV